MTYAEWCATKCPEGCARGVRREEHDGRMWHPVGHSDMWYGNDGTWRQCTAPSRDQFEQELQAELKRRQDAYFKTAYEVEQALGKALHYPKYADDPENFPEAIGTDAVCVGEHVPASLADEAAKRISELERDLKTAQDEAWANWNSFQRVERENAELRKDKALVDWLESLNVYVNIERVPGDVRKWCVHASRIATAYGENFREAGYAAMQSAGEQPTSKDCMCPSEEWIDVGPFCPQCGGKRFTYRSGERK